MANNLYKAIRILPLVARVVWDHEVGSSSLFTPTTKKIRAFSSVG